jgi:hypothetical protein
MNHWLWNHFVRTRWYSLVMRLKRKLDSVCSEILLILTQDRCMVRAKRSRGLKISLDAPDGTSRWRGSCGISFSVYFEIVLVSVQDRCTVCAERTTGFENHFGCTWWNSSGTWVTWKLVSVYLEIVLVLVQHRCRVCTKHTIGSEIVLDAPNGTLGDEAQVKAWFSLFGDMLILTQDRCTVCAERIRGSEIILDASDGTPMWGGSCRILFLSIWR